jgi:hypothetical protein
VNPALQSDYLFLGRLIAARLRTELGSELPVESVEQMADAVDARDVRPSVVYVVWSGERFGDRDAQRAGSAIKVQQLWTVWLRVRHQAVANADGRAEAAGPILAKIHAALHGWTPEGTHERALWRVQAPRPNYTQTSGLYPLTFDVNLAL